MENEFELALAGLLRGYRDIASTDSDPEDQQNEELNSQAIKSRREATRDERLRMHTLRHDAKWTFPAIADLMGFSASTGLCN